MLSYLIKACVCGNDWDFNRFFRHSIDIMECKNCGIYHQRVEMDDFDYRNFYATNYHDNYQTSQGQRSYFTRYDHDVNLANMRLTAYFEKIEENVRDGGRLLDVGSGNGAFVDTAREFGLDAWGVEPNPKIANKDRTYIGSIEHQNFKHESWDIITQHDVFEHFVNPVTILVECYRILKPGGFLIVDFPNFFVPEGHHHWRPIEHLWMFTQKQLKNLLVKYKFQVKYTYQPIPSKLVYYAQKPKGKPKEEPR